MFFIIDLKFLQKKFCLFPRKFLTTMDSLRNQIIGEPIEIEADTIEGLTLLNDLTKD